MSRNLLKLEEPKLLFRRRQALEDPRDGLALFGPLDEGKTFGIRPAVIGTSDGIERFKRWVKQIQRPINDATESRPPFPGFEAAFGVPFSARPVVELPINPDELTNPCRLDDPHQRVHTPVRLFAEKIKRAVEDEEEADVWFVVLPDEVYQSCRPESVVPKSVRIESQTALGKNHRPKAARHARPTL
jgi:hypothetical protein